MNPQNSSAFAGIVLDAAHVEDGPIAQAVLPYVLPLGFHGNFTAV